MKKHIYPSWHKPAQRFFFVLGAILLVTLPAIYGTTKTLSSETLALTLALYFGIWLVFSLVVRFALPSAQVESTLPTYTHVPTPAPILHTPNKHAVPAAPAIRIHHTTGSEPTLLLPNDNVTQLHSNRSSHPHPRKNARFAAMDSVDEHGRAAQDNYSDSLEFDNDIKRSNTGELENDDGRQHTPAVAAPASADATEDEARRGGPTDNKKANLSVTFEHHGRPRSPRMDSNTSESFPTYADYRQAQHGNFDAFAQRIKRAFLAATMAKPPTADPSSTFPSSPSSLASATSDRNGKDVQLSSISSSDDQLHPSTPSSGGKGGAGTKSTVSTGGRSRSTSAASVLSDIAEKIRSGTMLLGRSITQGGNQQSGSQSHIDRIDGGGSSHGHQHVVTGSFNHKPRARAVSDAGALQVAEMGNGPYHHVGHNSRPTRPSGLVRRSSSQLETISTGAKWDTGGGETGSTRNNTATTTATSYLAPYQPTQD